MGSSGDIRWISVKNNDAQDAPPYALMHVTGTDSDGNLTITRPIADNETGLMVNGPNIIPHGMYGTGHKQFPGIVAYTGGPPTNGQTWGSATSSWLLTTGKTGYLILGGGANGLVNVTEVTAVSAGGGGTTSNILISTSFFSTSFLNLTPLTLSTITFSVTGTYLAFANVNIHMLVGDTTGGDATILFAGTGGAIAVSAYNAHSGLRFLSAGTTMQFFIQIPLQTVVNVLSLPATLDLQASAFTGASSSAQADNVNDNTFYAIQMA